MRTKGTWSLRYLSGKIMVALVLATMICSLNVGSAIADDGRRYDNRHDERRWRGHDRGRHEGRRVYRTYRYVEPAPVYVAPPVYYAPPPEPGIRIFLPSIRIN